VRASAIHHRASICAIDDWTDLPIHISTIEQHYVAPMLPFLFVVFMVVILGVVALSSPSLSEARCRLTKRCSKPLAGRLW
jgi:hypothetical protein